MQRGEDPLVGSSRALGEASIVGSHFEELFKRKRAWGDGGRVVDERSLHEGFGGFGAIRCGCGCGCWFAWSVSSPMLLLGEISLLLICGLSLQVSEQHARWREGILLNAIRYRQIRRNSLCLITSAVGVGRIRRYINERGKQQAYLRRYLRVFISKLISGEY